MIFRNAIRWATFLLPVLLLVFAALMGSAWVAAVVGIGNAGSWMAGLAIVSGLALLVDVVLLVWLLGLTAVIRMDHREHGRKKWMKHREMQRRMGRRHHEEEGKRREGKRGKKRRED